MHIGQSIFQRFGPYGQVDENMGLGDAAYDAFGGKVAREGIDGFAAGRGTVFCHIDDAVVSALQESYALNEDSFPTLA